MKNILIWVSSLIILIGVGALWFVITQSQKNIEKNGNNTTVEVAATIFPVADLVRQVAGDRVVVHQLLPSGASPHIFQFTPKQIASLDGVDVVFGIGHGLDTWTEDLLETISADFVVLDSGIELKETFASEHHDEHEEDAEEDGHEHGPVDPHYWLNPYNSQAMIETIVAQLSARDPEHAQEYRQSADEYIQQELIPAIQQWEQIAREAKPQHVISLHDAWMYFADAFDVTIVGVFEPAATEEPSPRYIAELSHRITEAEQEGEPIDALWAEPQLSTKSLKAFANDHNLKIVVVDPLGGVEGRMSYIELLRYNINAVFNQ